MSRQVSRKLRQSLESWVRLLSMLSSILRIGLALAMIAFAVTVSDLFLILENLFPFKKEQYINLEKNIKEVIMYCKKCADYA